MQMRADARFRIVDSGIADLFCLFRKIYEYFLHLFSLYSFESIRNSFITFRTAQNGFVPAKSVQKRRRSLPVLWETLPLIHSHH